MIGIISRSMFQRQMLRPFGPAVFMNRPVAYC